jgi:NADH-quinone oxidoreductase subunit J
MLILILFILAGIIAVISSVLMILHKNPVVSALYLVLSFCSVALLFLLLGGPFIAAVQVIVYAGAIMVFFLFVIMLLNLKGVEEGEERRKVQRIIALYFVCIFAVLILYGFALSGGAAAVGFPAAPAPATAAAGGNAEAVADLLFTQYLFPFEIASVLLLAAMVGAVVLAKRNF